MLYAHIWGVAFLGESEHVGGIAGSLLLAGGVVVVNLPKAPTPDQDKTAAYSAGVDPRAVSFDDTRQASASLLGGRQDSGKEVEEELELAPIHV